MPTWSARTTLPSRPPRWPVASPRSVVRAEFWVLRGAYCRIEGRRVVVAGARAAPLARPVPGAESRRTSSVLRNTLHGRPEGVAGIDALQGCLRRTTPVGVSKDCCKTHAIAPATCTRPRTTTRAPNRRPPPFPLGDAVGAARAAGGVCAFDRDYLGQPRTPPSSVYKDCCETHAAAPATHTRLRTTTRAPNRRPPPFPLGDAVKRRAVQPATSASPSHRERCSTLDNRSPASGLAAGECAR